MPLSRTSASMSDLDLDEQLEAPLALLRTLSERSQRQHQFPTETQLRETLSQLQSAVGDLLDIAAAAISALLEQVEDELLPPGRAAEEARLELKAISMELEDQLAVLSDTLLGATSMEQLGEAQDEVRGVELAMALTLSRLGSVLESLDSFEPPAPPVAESSRIEEAGRLLELLTSAIESVDRHLVDGELSHFAQALAQLDDAAMVLRQLLSEGEAS